MGKVAQDNAQLRATMEGVGLPFIHHFLLTLGTPNEEDIEKVIKRKHGERFPYKEDKLGSRCNPIAITALFLDPKTSWG